MTRPNTIEDSPQVLQLSYLAFNEEFLKTKGEQCAFYNISWTGQVIQEIVQNQGTILHNSTQWL